VKLVQIGLKQLGLAITRLSNERSDEHSERNDNQSKRGREDDQSGVHARYSMLLRIS
jgi:hypothetical protein